MDSGDYSLPHFSAPLCPGLNIPPAPREPSRRARKLIFAYQGVQKVSLLVGAIFLGVGLLLSIPFCWGVPVDVAIALAHREQPGTILSARLDTSTRINGEHPTVVAYSYRTEAGELRGDCSTRDAAILEAAQPGASYPVQVARLNAGWSRLSGTTYSWTGYWGLFTLLFPIVGATTVGFAIRSNRREIRAFRHGHPILAKVVARGENPSVSVNGRHPFMVAWEFKVNDEVYSGSLSSMSLLALEELMNRDEIPVLYDPSNPAINTVFVS
jgi:hypothetical protein